MAQSILIVDDEKEIVSMLYCYFSKLGYTVYTATAGNAALKEVEKKPDIILLDVNMPDIEVIENNNLVISVSDDGCGFKNIEIEKATLPFYKSSKDISTEHLGLGLNISKILSERHGGNIQIANNKAGGACVTVKINCNES